MRCSRARFHIVLLALVVFVLGLSCADYNLVDVRVYGRVILEGAGGDHSGVTVTLDNWKQTTTDGDGDYAISGETNSTITVPVRFEAPGYESETVNVTIPYRIANRTVTTQVQVETVRLVRTE